MFSRAVRRPYPEVSPPDTMLIRWRIGNGSFVTSWPATSACPDVGRRSVARILMSVVLPAPLGPRSPNSSPSRIWRDTPSSAVTGPSDSSSSGVGLRRHQRFFFPENTRVRSRVSTAYDMGGVRPRTERRAEGGGLQGQPETVPGDVPRDPIAHQDAPDVRQFGHLRLVVVEVVRELVRIELRQLDRDSLDIRRPDISQRFTPLMRSEGALQGACAK